MPRASRPFGEMMLEHMNPGDGVTHCYGYGKPMIGNDGKVKPHYWEARDKGIIMDVGHGNNSFSFSMAVPAIEQGFPPDTISTDLHRMSLHTSRATQTEVMSKFLAIGCRCTTSLRIDLDTGTADRAPGARNVDTGSDCRCNRSGVRRASVRPERQRADRLSHHAGTGQADQSGDHQRRPDSIRLRRPVERGLDQRRRGRTWICRGNQVVVWESQGTMASRRSDMASSAHSRSYCACRFIQN